MKRYKISLLIIIFLIVVSIPVIAQEELPTPGLLPNHPFYGVVRWFEGVHMFFTFDDEAKAKLHLQFSERRLAEARAMIQKGKPEWAEGLMKDYMRELNETHRYLHRQIQRGKNVTHLFDMVYKRTYYHIGVLEDLTETVPAQARFGIEKALNVSLRGHEESVKRLENITGRKYVKRIRRGPPGNITEIIKGPGPLPEEEKGEPGPKVRGPGELPQEERGEEEPKIRGPGPENVTEEPKAKAPEQAGRRT
jgi:hypothetical protein